MSGCVLEKDNSNTNKCGEQCSAYIKEKYYCKINELVADTSCVEMIAVADAPPVPWRPKTQTFTNPSLSATE